MMRMVCRTAGLGDLARCVESCDDDRKCWGTFESVP